MKIAFTRILVPCCFMFAGWATACTSKAEVAEKPAVEKTQGAGAAASSRAQLFEGMGPHRRRITTDSSEAQHYFDQGLTWVFAFNHDEANLCSSVSSSWSLPVFIRAMMAFASSCRCYSGK